MIACEPRAYVTVGQIDLKLFQPLSLFVFASRCADPVPAMMSARLECDIFCTVIDNYGDIGVCWRLARQLAHEHGLAVRLWVDDLRSFARLCPAADAALERQMQRGVQVCAWHEAFPDVQPADIVIAAFACKLPENYVLAMARQPSPPVWINLEYLSAESWVAGCHGLPSPHPRLPLTKHFFFPGFTPDTGGLLLERDLLARRDAFLGDAAARQAYWRGLGMQAPGDDVLKVSLFAYENDALPALFDCWSQGAQRVLCLVPEGRILPQVAQYFGAAGRDYRRGNLSVRVLPFSAQEDYDLLLWACDVNFVRGEDSCVRAQWAGKPFVWQIYPQHDGVHDDKLQALLDLYAAALGTQARHALQAVWREWNGQGPMRGWPALLAAREQLQHHAQAWAEMLAQNPLSLNLLDFCQKVGRIRAFKIEGQ